MNFIKKLQAENFTKEQTIKAANDGINELKAYLQSSKFATDTTVQTSDVLLRLREITTAMNAVEVCAAAHTGLMD